jgi:hypothetical protein
MGETYNCLSCGRLNPVRGANYTNKYCNNQCQQNHRKQVLAEGRLRDWLDGCGLYVWKEVPPYVRDYLIKQNGNSCGVCRISEWCGKPAPLLARQLDGDPYNNKPANIGLICPNCLAQK